MAKTDITYRASLDPKGVKEGANAIKSEFGSMGEQFKGVAAAVKKYNDTMSKLGGGNVKGELRATTQAAVALEAEYRKLSDAEKASAQGQALRAKVDALIQRGGELKDTIADVGGAMGRVASDTAKLDSALQGLQAATAAVQVLGGAYAMLGGSEEDVAKIQKDLTALIAIANGLQTIQNALQRESALMQGVSAARTAAHNVALAVQNAMTKSNTIATKAAAAAQVIWNNVIKANPIGAMVTVVLAAAAAIYKLTSATDAEKAAEEGAKGAKEDIKQATADATKTAVEAGLQIEAYQHQIESFNGTQEEEKKLIDELNKKYGEQIGYYKDLASWKEALANMSALYVQVLLDEAKAQGLTAAIGKAYADQVSGELSFGEAEEKIKKLKAALSEVQEDLRFDKESLRIAKNINIKNLGGSYTSPKSSSSKQKKEKKTTKKEEKEPEKYTEDWWRKELEKEQKKLQATVAGTKAYFDQKKVVEDLEKKIKLLTTSASELKMDEDVKAVAPSLKDLQDKFKGLNVEVGNWKNLGIKDSFAILSEEVEKFNEKISTLQGGLRDFGTIFSSASKLAGEGAGQWLNYASSVTNAIAQALPQLSKMAVALGVVSASQAMSENAKMGPFGWISGIAAMASVIAAIMSLPKFAEGGIVGGTGFSGDRQLIRANSGEMVINRSQQAKLWSAISGGSIGGGQVVFKISGQELYGVLKNYNSKMSKVR